MITINDLQDIFNLFGVGVGVGVFFGSFPALIGWIINYIYKIIQL